MTHLPRCRLQRTTLARRAGFTLIELLVVIAIVIVLASLLVPAVNRARTAAKIADTQATLRALRVALEAFQNEFGFLPPVTQLDDDDNLIVVEVNTQFLDPAYRAGDTSDLDGGNEDWQEVRVVGDDPWIWEDTDGDEYCTAKDLLDDEEVDLSELLYLMVATNFVRMDDDGDPVGVFRVTDRSKDPDQVRTYYAKENNSSPYADLPGSRIGDLDRDENPEVLDAFRNPIIFSVGLRNEGAAELCSMGPDGRLDFVDLDGDGTWDRGTEPANDGEDNDGDGLIDEKSDEINNIPELVDDIVSWE